jgi:ribonuclease HII
MEKFKNNKYEVGIDEAGRGPFFGPVYAAAVIWGNAPDNEMIKDSKKLSKKKRKEALEWIKENVKAYGVGYCSSQEIDQYGILDATKKAMEKAINNIGNIPKKSKYKLLIDGIGWEKLEFETDLPKVDIESIVKGDSRFRNIAAASILAKEAHDHHIDQICSDNEDLNIKYDLLSNKGYGTKKHIEGIKKHGLSEFHRHSFNINY